MRAVNFFLKCFSTILLCFLDEDVEFEQSNYLEESSNSQQEGFGSALDPGKFFLWLKLCSSVTVSAINKSI